MTGLDVAVVGLDVQQDVGSVLTGDGLSHNIS